MKNRCPYCDGRYYFLAWRPLVECQTCGKRYLLKEP